MKRRSFLTQVPAFALGVSALGGPLAALAQGTRPLRMRLNADIRSTDPGVNRDANTDFIMSHVVEGLVGYRDDASVGPMLAESWEISEDGRTYTFTLREGVTFHNGAPLTSAEVVWCWSRYMDPETGWRGARDYNGERGLTVTAEAGDARTVIFTLDTPNALFLTNLARTDCGQTGIYHPDSLAADGSWSEPVGTGPFMLSQWERGQYLELTRFDDYAALDTPRTGLVGDKTPLVETVRYLIIPEDSSARAALLSGDIDIMPDVATADYAGFQSNPEITTDNVPGFGVGGFLLQTTDPVIGDLRMRQALKLALDAPQIVDILTEGLAEANQSVVPPGSPYFSEIMATPFQRDVARARDLAAEAGYDGTPIVLLATQHYPQLFDMAVMAQAMLAEAGITVEVEVLDWATLLDRYSSGNYQAMAFTFSARLDPALSYDMISGDKAEQPRKVWDNPKAREVLKRSMIESDPAQRQQLFDQLEEMFQADVPMIPLYSGNRISASRAAAEGYASWSVGSPRAWGVSLDEA
ncbi:MAG: ABC transporter substrate-binding protein [Rhodobacteraceae bacterium]|nr:ABC transporter substrate-binding protein [Paracoccaceae bacterium]MBR9820100.1 ABC transporter substrate-binding protein [Paracoccaceae bacterium]